MVITKRKRIAVGHPTMGRGGSEAACMWIIQALKDDFDITLVTTRTVDLVDLNRHYATSVQPDEIKMRMAPVPFFMKKNSSISALRGALYTRFTKQIGGEYDFCISAYNISNWGAPAFHFIADFTWDLEIRNSLLPQISRETRLIHKDNLLRKVYLAICWLIRGPSRSAKSFFDGSETIIANSRWTADIIREKYKYLCDGVIYPPVVADYKLLPWNKRAFGFVSIGRIAPEKRILEQIRILKNVRALGHDIHFHLIGGIGDDPYGRMVRSTCDGKPWITLEGHKSGAEKEALLTGHKFAIHTCNIEAFGIAVAEMVNAGCIPFIPDTGGQIEIVPFDELQFASIDEAVQKIDRMLGNVGTQQRILAKLNTQAALFSTERFCRQTSQIVNGHIECQQ